MSKQALKILTYERSMNVTKAAIVEDFISFELLPPHFLAK